MLGKSSGSCGPSKHAGSDPEAFWLRPVVAVTASVHCQNRAGSHMPDSTYRIRFSSVFPKAWIILRKTDPDPMWMAWSGFDQTHLVWKQAGVQESSGPVLAGRNRPATSFPTFRLGSVLPQTSRIILCKTIPAGIRFSSGRDCVRFWPNGSGPEASQCARIIRPASGQCFQADQMRIGSSMFTGSYTHDLNSNILHRRDSKHFKSMHVGCKTSA